MKAFKYFLVMSLLPLVLSLSQPCSADTTPTKMALIEAPAPIAPPVTREAELDAIHIEIQNSEKELTNYRKNALNSEIEAQPNMFDHWHTYAKDIQNSEDDEKRIFEIKERIKKLNIKKQEILKNKLEN